MDTPPPGHFQRTDTTDTIYFDTVGSEVSDTELALYGSNSWEAGYKIVDNNDYTPLGSLSQLSYSNFSSGRTYYIAVGGHNSTFNDEWGASSTSLRTGKVVLNHGGGSLIEFGTRSVTLQANSIIWFSFTIQ